MGITSPVPTCNGTSTCTHHTVHHSELPPRRSRPRRKGGCGGGRQDGRTPYNQGGGVGIPPFVLCPGQPGNARNMAPAYFNIVKKFNNMNYCFSCGFDVENSHTLKTCCYEKRHINHQEAANRSNAQQYIEAGYDACTKAKHKLILPGVF